MLIGQTLLANESGPTYYGPWMPRQGNKLRVVVKVVRASSSDISFSCAVRTKNREDADPTGSTGVLGTLVVTTTNGAVSTDTYTGCKELVRFEYTLTMEGSTEWIHFGVPAPIWAPN